MSGRARTDLHESTGRMPLPKDIKFVTFDVYGTLIDWEDGDLEAFGRRPSATASRSTRDELIPLFHETQREIKGGSYELYAEVLRRTAVQIAKELEWPLEPSRSGFLPDSVQRWKPFKETNPRSTGSRRSSRSASSSNIDDKLLGQTRRHIRGRLRPRGHRPAGPLLQARPRALQGVRAPHRRQEGLGARRVELLPRRRAVPEGEGPRGLGQPPQASSSSRARRSRPRRSRTSARRPSSSALA